MQLILEHPWLTLCIGLSIAAVFVQISLTTGKRYFLGISAVVVIISIILCVVSSQVVTERESVIAMLDESAAALEANDFDKVLACVYPTPSEALLSAKNAMQRCKFEVATVTKIHDIEFSGPPNARRAKVFMNVFLDVTISNFNRAIPQYVEMTLYRKDGRWLVYDFINSNPMDGFKNRLDLDANGEL